MVEITSIGFFIIPLSVILFFISERLLYSLLIFVIPFSATVVANVSYISSGTEGSGVMLFTYVAALWIVRMFLQNIYKGRLFFPRYQRQPLILLILFLFVSGMSLIMPVIIDGRLELLSANLAEQIAGVSLPLYFTPSHITRFIYLMLGILFTVFLSIRNSREESIHHTVKLYIISAIFVCIWGWMQWVFFIIDKPYPTIFNNSIAGSAQGYMAAFEDINIKRISSVTVEPSILAQFLLTALPFVIFSLYLNKPIISKTLDRMSLLLIISVLAISTSTSAYLGVIIMMSVTILVLYSLKLLNLSKVAFLIFFFLVTISTYFIMAGDDVIKIVLLSKTESYSFLERINSVIIAFSYFLQYPLLGIGWGSVTSHDLFVRTLADVGIVGLTVLILIIFFVIRNFIQTRKYLLKCRDYRTVFWGGAGASFIILLIICAVTGFPFVFGHFWFTIGMTIAVSAGHRIIGETSRLRRSEHRLSGV